jgi:DNA-directed RNA polymerase specialized sigma24 family protein
VHALVALGEAVTIPVDDDAVFARVYPALRRFAAVTAPDADPDDLVQEAVARTLRRHTLGALDHPEAYLRRTIVHLASNRRRSLARWRTASARLATVEPVTTPAYAGDVADLLRLPPAARALLWLVEVEGCDYSEAASQLGISSEAARQRAARARRALRAAIEGDELR